MTEDEIQKSRGIWDKDKDWDDAWGAGADGYLRGWQYSKLFIEGVRTEFATWLNIPGETLARRLPEIWKNMVEEYDDVSWVDEPHIYRDIQRMSGFVWKVVQLEAEGKNPMIRVSW